MDERFHAEVCLLLFSGEGEAQAVCCHGQDSMDFLHEVGFCRFSQARMDAYVFYVHYIDNSSELITLQCSLVSNDEGVL
jgi:hypothetical protein